MKNNNRSQNIVWGSLLIVFGMLVLLDRFVNFTGWVWVAILMVVGVGVFIIYASDRSKKALLIPVYILWVIAIFISLLLLDILQDAFVATFVLTAVAIPFLIAFLQDRSKWGFLIPAYVLLAVGFMIPLLEQGILYEGLIPAYVMFAISIPFLAAFLKNHKNRWALIPGGILAVIGFAFIVAEAAVEYILPAILILTGVGVLLSQLFQNEPAQDDITIKKD